MVRTSWKQRKRLLEASLDRMMIRMETQVPLATHAREVASFRKQLGKSNDTIVQVAFMSWLTSVRRRCTSHLMQLS